MASIGYTLESLVPIYPSQDDPNIQSIIASKKEYNELKPEDTRVDDIYYNHQVLFQRIHSEFNKLFLIAGAGSGKTGMEICFREWMSENRPDEYKKYYFITGGTQIEDFKNQLVTKFAKGKYDLNVHILTKDLSEKAAEKRGARLVKSYIGNNYALMTYGDFRKYISQFTNTELEKEFSNVAVFIDEIQMMKIDPQLDLQILRSISDGEEDASTDDSSASSVEEDMDDEYSVVSKKKKPKSKKKDREERERIETYTQIWKALHAGKNTAITISTATPITNHQDEAIYEYNLILPADKQIWSEISERIVEKAGIDVKWYNPGRKPLDMDEIQIDELEKIMRGMIMYIREPRTGAIEAYPKRVPGDELSIIPEYVHMSEFQSEAFARSSGEKKISIDANESDQELSKNAFLNAALQSSNFVYPNGPQNVTGNKGGLWGKEGFFAVSDTEVIIKEGWVESRKTTKVSKKTVFRPKPWFAAYLRDLKNIERSSVKMFQIVEGALNKKTGKRYVSTRYYKYSGALILGWCLSAQRFDEYVGDSSAFERFHDGSKRIKLSIPERPRYAIITGSNSNKKNHSNIFELFNSPENVRGAYIKVIIVTKVGQVGINLADIEYVDSLEGDWTPQAKYQKDRRAFRATSHVNSLEWLKDHEQVDLRQRTLQQENTQEIVEIPLESRQKISLENTQKTIQKNNGVEFKVFVNYYIALPDLEYLEKLHYGKIEAVDFQLYAVMEAKDRVFSRLFRMMKRIAIDYWINRSRNILTGVYPDGSPECDYDTCDYEPYPPRKESLPLDTSTYEAYYAKRRINQTITLLKEYFTDYNEASHSDLINAFSRQNINERDLVLGLEKIIHNRIPFIVNRIGHEMYLNEDSGRYYISHTRRSYINSSCSYYEANLIAIERSSLNDITLEYTTDVAQPQIQDLYSGDVVHNRNYVDYLYSLPIDHRALYFEDAVLRKEDPNISDHDLFIADNIIKVFDKISMYIENQYVNIINKKDQNSRKRKGDRTLVEKQKSALGKVWVHFIYGINVGDAKYDIVRKTLAVNGRLRILTAEGEWRDVAKGAEQEVYSRLLSERIKQELVNFSGFPIIGIIVTNDTFHLRDNKKEDITKLAGRECKSLSKIEILNMMFRSGYDDPIQPIKYSAADRENIIRETKQKLASTADSNKIQNEAIPDELLKFYYNNADLSPAQLCYKFFKYLWEGKMIFDLLGTQDAIYEELRAAAKAKKGRPAR